MWITIGRNLLSTTTSVEEIYVGGFFTTYNGIAEPYIARLNTDGSLDTSFAPVGTGLSSDVSFLAFDSSGKVYVAGCFGTYNGTFARSVARLNTDGSLDTTFLPTGGGLNNCGGPLSIDSSGKVIAGGYFNFYNITNLEDIARLNTDGSLDTTLTYTGTGLNGGVNATAIDSSGKILVGGVFTSYNGTSEPYVVRLNTDGSLDATFTPTGTGLNSTVNALAIDSSGKIIVGGNFTSYNGTSEPFVARLNTNGSLDGTFAQTGTGLNNTSAPNVNALTIDSSGKIIVGGNFTSYNGTSEPFIVRLNTNGSLDTTFNPVGTGLNSNVSALAIDSSGKIVVGGNFNSYNGTSVPNVAILNSDGSLDTTFGRTGVGFNNVVFAIAVRFIQK